MQTTIWLGMVTADGGERPFPLRKARVVIGRDTHCDLRVALPPVSLNHCELTLVEGVLKLRDLGSMSGTFHNGVRVMQATLAPDDRLTVGPVTFVVRTNFTGRDPGATLSEAKPVSSEGRAVVGS